jgi:hypothetical protein
MFAIAWSNLTLGIEWWVPKGPYWICGEQTYTVLPNDWFGSCMLGTIWPSFFLLPLRQGEKLAVSMYEERVNRKKQDALQIGTGRTMNGLLSGSFNIIIPLHGQKMAPGAIAPIHMLNCIIRLQRAVEIVTNETAKALYILTKQQSKIHNATYQHHWALDYLLASEGEVWEVQSE